MIIEHEIIGSPETTQTDFSCIVDTETDSLILNLTKYKNGTHNIEREGDVVIPLSSDPNYDKEIKIYLADGGLFIVDEILQDGLHEPSTITGMVDRLVWFTLPTGGSLADCEIHCIKVVE